MCYLLVLADDESMRTEATARDASFYRVRAEEMRSIAELMSNEDARERMLGVAASYDRLAEQAEQNLASAASKPDGGTGEGYGG
jgi:hypothetical protein